MKDFWGANNIILPYLGASYLGDVHFEKFIMM